jgi:hypothetical protein
MSCAQVRCLRKWLKEMEQRIDPLQFSKAAEWRSPRQRCKSGFNRVSGSGSGSRRAKITLKSRKKKLIVHILKCWMASFES